MPERRRDDRIDVELPFRLTDRDSAAEWRCKTLDVSPTGILLEVDKDNAPQLGAIVDVSIQGPAEQGWEHVNTRPMRVVRVEANQAGLTYAELTVVENENSMPDQATEPASG